MTQRHHWDFTHFIEILDCLRQSPWASAGFPLAVFMLEDLFTNVMSSFFGHSNNAVINSLFNICVVNAWDVHAQAHLIKLINMHASLSYCLHPEKGIRIQFKIQIISHIDQANRLFFQGHSLLRNYFHWGNKKREDQMFIQFPSFPVFTHLSLCTKLPCSCFGNTGHSSYFLFFFCQVSFQVADIAESGQRSFLSFGVFFSSI